MIPAIQTESGGNISGTVEWPTVFNSMARVKGSTSDDGQTLDFIEDEFIRGRNIVLPFSYQCAISGKGASPRPRSGPHHN